MSGTTCRPNSMQFLPIRTPIAPRRARHFFSKQTGKNCKEAFFTRFPGFRLSPPLPSATRLRGPFQSGVGWWARTLVDRQSKMYNKMIEAAKKNGSDSLFGASLNAFCLFFRCHFKRFCLIFRCHFGTLFV